MKKFDSVSIIGIVACVIVMILLFMRMQSRVAQQQMQQAEAMPTEATSPAPVQSPAGTPAAPVAETKPAGEAAAPAAAPVTSTEPLAPVDPLLPVGVAPRAASGKAAIELTREGESVVKIDPCGAGVVGVELKKYMRQVSGKEESSTVVLGSYDYPFLALSSLASKLELQAVKESDVAVDTANQSVTISRQSLDGKLKVTETWRVPKDIPYEIEYDVAFSNLSDVPLRLQDYVVEIGGISPTMSGPRDAEKGYGGGASYMLPPADSNHCNIFSPGDLDKSGKALSVILDPASSDKKREEAREDLKSVSDVAWGCVHTRYFMQGIRSREPKFTFATMDVFSRPDTPERSEADSLLVRFCGRLALPAIELPAKGEKKLELAGYVGPMDVNILSDKGIGLEGILGVDRFFWMTPSWMGALSKFFLNALLWLSKLFPGSYAVGFALILLTLIVKAVFWPLSYKGTKSMKKMQELQPQLKELREKYKSDPQEMYRRQNELFKENHVSQFGGCLPMLVQIPIFFALFNTFRGSIELRQEAFLWASDLSLPDTVFNLGVIPVNPFAIIMGAAMIWQQMQMPSGEPSQKRMMMMMSIVFVYFLYSQPSGLALYMTVNMFLSMFQTWLIKKLEQKNSAAVKTAKGK